MAKFWSPWVFLCTTFFAGCCQASADSFKSQQVFVSSSLCDKDIHMDFSHEKWKRLLVPKDEACSGVFDCQVTFKMTNRMSTAAYICVDYSRLQVHGIKTTFIVYEKSDSGTNDDPVFRQRLDYERYPAVEKYLSVVVCINARNALILRFTADCDRRLDRSFISWIYVYVQPSDTHSIYFVDGTSKHRHKIAKNNQSKVTLRSFIWADTHGDLRQQQSSFRFSLSSSFEIAQLCIKWSSARHDVPVGWRLSIKKTYFNSDLSNPIVTYISLKEGDSMPVGSHCYSLRYIHDIAVIVHRNRDQEEVDLLNNGELLFELVAEAKPPELEMSGDEEEFPDDVDFEDMDAESDVSIFSDSKSTMILFLKIVLGCGAATAALCCVCSIARKASRGMSEASSPDRELDPQPFQPGMHTESNTWTTGNTDNTVATAPQPESCPMMSIASASAPWEEAEDDNSMMTWPASGLRDAPPSYDTVSARVEQPAPPVYEDLFPISKT